MGAAQSTHPQDRSRHARSTVLGTIAALSMTIGRGSGARAIADAAGLLPSDRVLDIGCGPGAAVRHAARRAAVATGVDPSPVALSLARRISTLRHIANVAWLAGHAEALPLSDGAVTVAWALHSLHHWDDQQAGLREIHRVLAPGGRLLLAERLLARPRGHSAHGLTRDQAAELAQHLADTGFAEVQTETRQAGRQTLVIVRGHVTLAGDDARTPLDSP